MVTSEENRRLTENKLAYYKPYPKQLAFHTAGASVRERLLMAANQSGKSYAGGMEAAMHATGIYPSWWEGKRFDAPTIGWVCGQTNEQVRDVAQRVLVGRPGSIGTGAIPKESIVECVSGRGISDLLDSVRVQHVNGGVSTIAFKSYISGRERFQGETLQWAWLDEECDVEIFTEVLTRLNIGQGPLWMTFTPLLGVSEVVRRFVVEKSEDRRVITMTLDDVDHYTDEEKKKIEASYPEHEREARARGIPTLGSGRIFPVSEKSIVCDHRDIPAHWPRIGGMDFGWTHNFAAAEVAWDRDHDVVYLIRTHRMKEATPIMHAATLRAWGRHLRWAWPRDGRRQTLEGAGVPLMEQYRDQGLDMLWEHSQFEDKSVSVEAGLMQWLDRMKSGRFKVFRELNDFFEEFRLYHRRDGKVFAENDDLLCAVRYALMMLRYARTDTAARNFNREIKYPKAGY
jgi:phage terminase large subunit-like protein